MKRYKIGTTGEQRTDGGISGNAYSIYENIDADLKKQIQEFDIDRTKVTMGYPHGVWDILEWEDEEVKCGQERNIHYFKRTEVEEQLKRKKSEARNEKFNVKQHFKRIFGPLSEFREETYKSADRTYYSMYLSKINGPDDDRTPSYHFRCDDKGGKIELDITSYTRGADLKFNDDGDFVSRDYNLILDRYSTEDINPTILFDEFKKRILALTDLIGLPKAERFFGNKHCYIPYAYGERGDFKLGVEAIAENPYNKGSYKEYRKPLIYIPLKAVEKTSQQMLDLIITKIPEDLKYLLDGYFEK